MKIKHIIMLFVVVLVFTACSNDDLSSESIFDTSEVQRNEFDKWLKANYTDPYNIEFNYLYNDNLSDNEYNVVPAKFENSKAIAILMKHVWMDAYEEVAGRDFLKKHCFRQMQLIGSPEFDSQSSIVLGTAEGGLKVTLFRVNEIDLDTIFINQDQPYRGHFVYPLDLNVWFFHTMHHEFCHILTQTVNYTTDFQTISAGSYHSADWVNLDDEYSPSEGFVTGYASDEYNEDFAETYSTYVTYSDEGWNKVLAQGVDTISCDTVYEDYVDDDGYTYYQMDANGYLVPDTDADGNIVYQTDENGNYIYFTIDEEKVPVYQAQSTRLIYFLDENGEPYIAWKSGSRTYSLDQHSKIDKPLYQMTEEGDTVYDKSGNPVVEYYKLPKFKYVQKTVYKNVVENTTGRDHILEKLAIVKSYFKNSWGIDIDELRKVVLRRSVEASSLDLKNLK